MTVQLSIIREKQIGISTFIFYNFKRIKILGRFPFQLLGELKLKNKTGEIVTFSGEYTSKNGLELNSSYIESSKVSFKDDETCKQSEECVCKNISPLPPPSLSLRWRFETWVTVVVTIGAVGVVLTACIALFIMCKACTEVLVNHLVDYLGSVF